jgi:hypothetical protein
MEFRDQIVAEEAWLASKKKDRRPMPPNSSSS